MEDAMNDFLMTQLAREYLNRVVRDAELARLVQAAETSDVSPRHKRRRHTRPDHR
jgi:hypothetical protein